MVYIMQGMPVEGFLPLPPRRWCDRLDMIPKYRGGVFARWKTPIYEGGVFPPENPYLRMDHFTALITNEPIFDLSLAYPHLRMSLIST